MSDLARQPTREELIAELAAAEEQIAAHAEQRIKLAVRSPQRFAEYVIKDEKSDELIVLDQMHKLWFEFILSCWKRGLTPFILAPYGSGKTTLILSLILWMLGRDPDLRVKIVSASDDLAIDRARLVQSYIETSPELHQLFPHLLPDFKKGWQVKRMFVTRTTKSKDATIQALGGTSSAQGSRTDLLVLDDINDLRNTVIYPRLRKTVTRNFTFLLTRVEPEVGKTVVIMTRWHVDDVFGAVTKDSAMCQQYGFLIQAVSDDLQSLECEIVLGNGGKPRPQLPPTDPIEQVLESYEQAWATAPKANSVPTCRGDVPWAGEAAVHLHRRLPLWSLRLSPEILKARLAEMGDREFDRGFRQRAISDADLLWREGHVEACLDKTHTAVSGSIAGDRWDGCARYMGVDLAISTDSEEAAYFVIFILAVDAEKRRWPLWLVRERGLTFGQQVAAIKEYAVRFRPTIIRVENNAYQDAIRQHLGETTDLPVDGYKTGAIEKRDTEIGVPSLAVEWEHKSWHVPWGNAESQRLFGPLVREVATYPNTRYTDCVMAMLFARSCALAPVSGPQPRVHVVRF